MADESERYNRSAIRQLLLAVFNAEELHELFYFAKAPELQAVSNEFAEGDSLPAMVRKAVRYCDSRFLLGEMLAEVKAANPRAYEKYEAMLGAPARAAPSQVLGRWPVWGLAAAAVVVVVSLGVVLALLLGGPGPTPEPTLTEVAQATGTPSITPTLASSPSSVPAPIYTQTATAPPEPTPILSPTGTAGPSPMPPPTLEPAPGPQFIVLRILSIRSGPGLSFPIVGTVYDGDLLEVSGAPEVGKDWRQWPVHTVWERGWVSEWTGNIRLIKPFMKAGDTVVVANPIDTGDVQLYESCEDPQVVTRGTALTVIGGPDPTKCDDTDETISKMGREWWHVETPEGQQGWIADFSSEDLRYRPKPMLIAPQWYVELMAP